jgi:secreted trypsin-like serine protease
MRVTSVLLAVTLAAATLVTPYAAAQAGEVGSTVVGGGPASSGPWAAGLYTADGGFGFFCSGTIIAKRWVLSAHHCVSAYKADHVYVGNVNLYKGTRAKVRRVVTSPDSDFALLELSTDVTATYAPLATADPRVGAAVDFYGWGTTSREDEQTLSPFLKKGTLRVIDYGEDVYGGPSIHGEKINAVAGYGDSGGPMFSNGKLVGVCSWGDMEYVHSDYGSVAKNRSWIRRTAGV